MITYPFTFTKTNVMARIIVAFMKDVLKQYNNDEISFSRMCELINEEAERDKVHITKMKGSKEEGGYIYLVNSDGTVNPWSNPMKSISEALDYKYIPKQIKVRDILYNVVLDIKVSDEDIELEAHKRLEALNYLTCQNTYLKGFDDGAKAMRDGQIKTKE